MATSQSAAQIATAVLTSQQSAERARAAAYQATLAANKINQISVNALYWQGNWDTTVYYNKLAVVLFGSDLYASLQDANHGHSPDVSPSYWQPFGSGGGGGTVHTSSGVTGDGSPGTPVALAPIAQSLILGRASVGTGPVESLTPSQLTALLPAATTSVQGAMAPADKTKLNALVVSAPTATILYVSPNGSNANDGKTQFTPKLTWLSAYDALPSNGGTIIGESGCKWSNGTEGGGVVDNNPVWLVDGPLVPPGWRRYKTVALLGSPGEPPGQGGFNTAPRSVINFSPVGIDRFKSTGLWLVGPCQRFFMKDILLNGSAGTILRDGWDYRRDSSGNPVGAAVTSAVRAAGSTVLTLAQETLPVASASRTNSVLTLKIPLTSFPSGVLSLSQQCIVNFTSTNTGLFPSGTFTALIIGSDGTNGIILVSQGGGDVGSVNIPGSTIVTHGFGVGDRFDLVSTDANFPSTMYGKVTAADQTTITVPDPYSPSSATGTNIGNAFFQDRASFAYYLHSIENVFGQLFGNNQPDQYWKGPCVDLGCSGFGGPSVFHDGCSWVGQELVLPNVCPDPDRACAILMDGGAGAVTGPTLVNSRVTTQFGGIRAYTGVASTIIVDNMLQDTAIGGSSPPCVEIFNASGVDTSVIILNNCQQADAVNGSDANIVLHNTIASSVLVSQCGVVKGAATIAANAANNAWASYTGTLPNFERQVGPWVNNQIAGYHPAARLIFGPQTVRSQSIFDSNPTVWNKGNCTITSGITAQDGTATAYRITPNAGQPFLLFFDGNNDPITGAPMVMSVGDQWAVYLETRRVSGSGSLICEYAFHPSTSNPTSLSLHPLPDTGEQGDWRFYGDWGVVDYVPFGPTSGIRCLLQSSDTTSVFDFRITILRIPVGTMTNNAFGDLVATMRMAPTYLKPGICGTMNTQPFIGHGGLGISTAVTKVAGVGSGQLTVGSIATYEPRLAADGVTIIGWAPLYSATVNP